jgi:dTDP-4-dehydrorhamnose reductase
MRKINVKGVEYIAEASRAIDAYNSHLTYIFDGKNGPYDENAIPDR